jgi:HSP20 family protein
MYTISRWDPIRGLTSLHDQVNRLLDSSFSRRTNTDTDLATWAPAVDIYETEGELVVKADLPDLEEKDIDVRIENNVLSIRGERKFEKTISPDNYLRVERTYGAFSRSFSLPNTIDSEQIHAEYRNGALSVRMPKREESKPKQIKVSISANQAK